MVSLSMSLLLELSIMAATKTTACQLSVSGVRPMAGHTVIVVSTRRITCYKQVLAVCLPTQQTALRMVPKLVAKQTADA